MGVPNPLAPNTHNVTNYSALQNATDGLTTGVTSGGHQVSLVFNDCSTNVGNPRVLLGGVEQEAVLATNGISALAGSNSATNGAHVLTPTFSSGVAAQLSDTTRDYMVYLTIHTAGTANVLAIGPTSTPANTLINSETATAGQMMTVRLPAGWYLEWTATTATLGTQTAISC